MKTPKSPMPAVAPAASFSPSGPVSAPTALKMAQPKGPGGQGFLINHNAFTDARPDPARGMKKSTGYPNLPRPIG